MEKKELMKIIGNNLLKIRSEKKLTQDELAEKAGISTSFYANIERGNKGVSVSVLRDLADCLHVSVDYLLYEERTDARIRNIELLLNGKPDTFVASIERMIQLCMEEFTGIG